MPRDGTKTRERILDAAERLVIDNGFSATSVDRVIAESGTSKGSFFHHFTSKVDLATALVERYAAADVGNLHEALATAREGTDDPARQVVEFLSIFEESGDELMAEQSSCLYIALLAERQLADTGTAPAILGAIEAWRHEVAVMLGEAGYDGDADALADHVFATFEGAFILCRSTGDPSHMRTQLGVLRELVAARLGVPAA